MTLRDRWASPSSLSTQSAERCPSLRGIETTTVSAPLGILTRLAGAKVDPLTVAVSRRLFGIYQLGECGNAQMERIFSNLVAFPSFKGILWFGFGVKHPIHILSDTAQGTACVAVCAALGEVHSDCMAARIIDCMATELWSDGEDQYQLRPSLTQWGQLVQCCQGLLARTGFGCFAEDIMKLSDESTESHVHLWSSLTIRENPLARLPGDIRPTAQALIALANLSTRTIESIELMGKAECGFIVALASWFFDFSVLVKRLETDDILFERSSNSHAAAQVVWFISSCGADVPVSVVSRSYVISSGLDLFVQDDPPTYQLSGRINWDTAISHCFGLAAKHLFDLPSCLGIILGTAARMFTKKASCDPGARWSWYTNRFDGSHGLGFVNTATACLPELQPIRTTMETTLSYPFEKASREYQLAIAKITAVCSCKLCKRRPPDRHYGDGRQDEEEDEYQFCLPNLACFIVRFVQLLSRVHLLGELQSIKPSRSGIEMIYRTYEDDHSLESVASTVEGLVNAYSVKGLLKDIGLLYAGKTIDNQDLRRDAFGPSAIEVGGFCVFTDAVRTISDDVSTAQIVNVVPGHIMHGSQFHRIIRDYHRKPPNYPALNITHNVTDLEVLHSDQNRENLYEPRIDVALVAHEGFGSLALSYHLRSQAGECWIGPADFTRSLSMAQRLYTTCTSAHQPCASQGRLNRKMSIVAGEGSYDRDGAELILRQVGNHPLARCIGVATLSHKGLVLDKNQCLACAIRFAERLHGSGSRDALELIY